MNLRKLKLKVVPRWVFVPHWHEEVRVLDHDDHGNVMVASDEQEDGVYWLMADEYEPVR